MWRGRSFPCVRRPTLQESLFFSVFDVVREGQGRVSSTCIVVDDTGTCEGGLRSRYGVSSCAWRREAGCAVISHKRKASGGGAPHAPVYWPRDLRDVLYLVTERVRC